MNVEVNLLAVLLAAVASMVIGLLWYSPILFGKPWMKLMGYTAKELKAEQAKMGPYYALSFALSLVTAYVLNHVLVYSMNFYNYPAVSTGITTGLFMWLGFVAPVQATDVIFGKKSWKLYWINTSYQLTSLIVMGVILGLFV